MNHLVKQSPIGNALQIVDALRIAKEIREDLSRQLFSVFLFQQSHLLDLVAEGDISKTWAKRNQREIKEIGRSCIRRGGSYLPQWLGVNGDRCGFAGFSTVGSDEPAEWVRTDPLSRRCCISF